MSLPPFLKSRKFWALIIGAAVVVLRGYVPSFPLSDEQVTELGLLIVAYIIGTGMEDSAPVINWRRDPPAVARTLPQTDPALTRPRL